MVTSNLRGLRERVQERKKEDRGVKTKRIEWESMVVGGLIQMQGGKKKSFKDRKKMCQKQQKKEDTKIILK